MGWFNTTVTVSPSAGLEITRNIGGVFVTFSEDQSGVMVCITHEQYEMLGRHFSRPVGDRPLGDIVMPVRLRNALSRMGAKTLRDAAAFSRRSLLEVPNFGRKSLSDLTRILEANGLRHGDD